MIALFVTGWAFWLLAGFPQLFDQRDFYPAVLEIQWTMDMIYALNRALMAVLFLVYYSFYSRRTTPFFQA